MLFYFKYLNFKSLIYIFFLEIECNYRTSMNMRLVISLRFSLLPHTFILLLHIIAVNEKLGRSSEKMFTFLVNLCKYFNLKKP